MLENPLETLVDIRDPGAPQSRDSISLPPRKSERDGKLRSGGGLYSVTPVQGATGERAVPEKQSCTLLDPLQMKDLRANRINALKSRVPTL